MLKTKKSELTINCVRNESRCVYEEAEGSWGKVVFSFRDDRFTYVWDKKTEDIYNDDSRALIRLKCALLIPRTILQIVANVIYNVARTAFKKASRTLYYGVPSVGAAAYGIINPYEGRKLYSMYERAYNREKKYVDIKNTYYVAPCFVPLNFNTMNKEDSSYSIETIKRHVFRHKYGL